MTNVPVVCANCGAKYRIPANFQKDSAKCKACGGTIDVRSQLDAAAAGGATEARPAKAAKAPAKSATASAAKDRSKPTAAKSGARSGSSRRRAAASDDNAKPSRSGARGNGRTAKGAGDDGEGRGSRRGGGRGRGEREEKKSNPAVLYGSLVGLVAVIVVVLVFVMGGDDPKKSDTAKNTEAAKTDGDNSPKADESPKVDEPVAKLDPKVQKSIDAMVSVRSELEPADQTKLDEMLEMIRADPTDLASPGKKLSELSAAGMIKVAVADARSEGAPEEQIAMLEKMGDNPAMVEMIRQQLNAAFSGMAAAKPASAKKSDTAKAAKPRKKGQPLTSKDQVFDPKTLPKLEYPDYVKADAELTAELDALAEAVKYSDFQGQKALEKLVAKGHAGIVPLVNALRELDYFDASDTRVAFSIHKRLKSLSGGSLTNFELPASEEISLDVAHKNARGARGWQKIWNAYRDKDKWDQMMADYRKKQRKQNK